MPEQKIEQWMRDAADDYLGIPPRCHCHVCLEKYDRFIHIIAAHAPTPAPTASASTPDERAPEAVKLLREIWADWEYYDETNATVWNPSVSLFNRVRKWGAGEKGAGQ